MKTVMVAMFLHTETNVELPDSKSAPVTSKD